MSAPPPKKLTRIHLAVLALTLIMGAGVTYAFDSLRARAYPNFERRESPWRSRRSQTVQWLPRRVIDDACVFWSVLTLGTALIVVPTQRRARPRPWRGWGATAVVSITLAGLVLVAKDLLWLGLVWPPPTVPVGLLVNDLNRMSGIFLGVYMASALSSPAHFRPDWRERLARMVGWGWMLYLAYQLALPTFR